MESGYHHVQSCAYVSRVWNVTKRCGRRHIYRCRIVSKEYNTNLKEMDMEKHGFFDRFTPIECAHRYMYSRLIEGCTYTELKGLMEQYVARNRDLLRYWDVDRTISRDHLRKEMSYVSRRMYMSGITQSFVGNEYMWLDKQSVVQHKDVIPLMFDVYDDYVVAHGSLRSDASRKLTLWLDHKRSLYEEKGII